MTTLAGTISTFEGDPDDMVLVTTDGVVSAAQETDPEIANFLRAAVGTACPGFYRSKADIILDAQAAGDEITAGQYFIPPCVWLRRYAPFLFAGDFQQTGVEVDFNSGTWLLSATFLSLSRERTFAIPSNNCWETIDTYRNFYWHGPRPQIVAATLNEPYCFYPQGASSFSVPGGGVFGSPKGERDFKNGSATIVLVEPDTTKVTRDNLTGTPFMPLPPIPDGYPEPPNTPPPLQGQISSDEISDEVANDICRRGGAFLTWWDIGNRAPNQEEGERQWMQYWTQVLGDLNTEIAPDLANVATEEILTTTTQIVLGKILDRVVDAGKVVIKTGGANKILTVLGPAGKIIQTIEIASELIQEINMLLQQLYVPQCIDSHPPEAVGLLRMMPIPFPVQTLDGESTLAGMQAICDALYSLLRCCPPCATDIWHDGPTLSTEFDWLTDFLPSAVLFQKVEVKYLENASMGGQDKLGYFKWILQDDEALSTSEFQEPIWVNTDNSFFFVKNGLVKGLRWVPQNGVTVKILYKYAPQELGLNRLTAPQTP